jgi:hypothetical protein
MAKPKEVWRHLALLISILFLFLVSPAAAASRGALVLSITAASYNLPLPSISPMQGRPRELGPDFQIQLGRCFASITGFV